MIDENINDDMPVSSKSFEGRSIAFLLLILIPIITIGIVGGYGFLVWMLQVIFGPPGA